MKVSLVQFNIIWKDKQANFNRIEDLIQNNSCDLLVLPEMFQTGFCTDDKSLAETMDGETVSWMKTVSMDYDSAICGSFICKEGEPIFNRFVLVSEGEVVGHYDKTHLFGLGGEGDFIEAGSTKVDMVVKGFKIRPIICYDLRFPYTAFNDSDYDVLLNVANWPSQRIVHWDALLRARAIENQAYVIGSNRVGEQDGHFYPGHSSVYSPSGEQLVHSVKEEVLSIEIQKNKIDETREKLPFLKDRRM
ncbi:MAG: nitrilase family protein [Bacteroidetes bacterium]|nr:MAG: nitrilase family protein [Bacteroidota bacterium]